MGGLLDRGRPTDRDRRLAVRGRRVDMARLTPHDGEPMKKRIRLTVWAAAFVFTGAAGCAPDVRCPTDWCGTVVVITGAEPSTLLPPFTQFDVEIGISDLLFLKLADLGTDLNTIDPETFGPRLAASWAFEDSLTLRLDLDPAARWHDGTPVTASDVVFTFDMYRDSSIAARARSRISRIASVSARDGRSVEIRFDRAYPESFFDAVYHVRVLPKHLLDTIPRSALATHSIARRPMGNGPFRLTRWNTGELMDFAADSSFFLGRPGPRRIVWRFAGDPSAAATQVLAGEADFLNALRRDDISRVEADERVQVIPYPSVAYAYIVFNLRDPREPSQPHPIFRDRTVRRALAMAVNRSGIVRAVRGDWGNVPPGPVTRALSIWDEDLGAWPFDTTQARTLLDSAGWRDTDGNGIRDRGGQPLRFELVLPNSSNDRQRSAVIVQEQLRRVGVEMVITPLDPGTWIERSTSGQFDANFGARNQDPSPGTILEAWSSAGIGADNWAQYVNPTVDSLFRAALETYDPDAAVAAWRDAIRRINQDTPAIWMYSPVQAAAVHRRILNPSIRPDEWWATLWTWRVSPNALLARDVIN